MCQVFNEELFECSFITISLLLEIFKKNLIDITDFKSNTEIKISYIQDNLEHINQIERRSLIESVIRECIEINRSF
ncbi:hypothetical protein [Ruminiclostridium cellulolyticum]|uniref:Uncharacterized protein n=1 Tax=Ruminiclostridium cellulolyticum (strain ATCC 35319 / DSM 5812 / JCM 6584 / H10) TaxID=394503 RepID=B8I3G3_RUMCH|nr:hypothetical protein [Ruminiclostridium cellulolyticum]ACL76306.1 hypothetical protein Ccel_1958 [Ruminiclostridium cellulolyticum H10]